MCASAAILMGGKNSRMSGQNKAFIKFGNQMIIDRMLGVITPIFSEIIFVVNADNQLFKSYTNTKVTHDIFHGKGALGGIHAALCSSTHEHCFIFACDLPLIESNLINKMLNNISERYYAIVPIHNQGIEPLHAVYSKKIIPDLETYFKNEHSNKISDFLERIQVKYIETENSHIFANINTPDDLEYYSIFISTHS